MVGDLRMVHARSSLFPRHRPERTVDPLRAGFALPKPQAVSPALRTRVGDWSIGPDDRAGTTDVTR